MHFRKYHGLGNDYLVLESGDLHPGQVVGICDRHRGLGSDGILELLPSKAADVGLRIWYPDGSVAEKSGNGLRIFARWLVEHRGASEDLTVELPDTRRASARSVVSLEPDVWSLVTVQPMASDGRCLVVAARARASR